MKTTYHDNKLIAYFSRISPLSDEEARAIEKSMSPKIFKKGAVLLKEGEISVDTYFVLEGCIRQYLIVDGEEKTTNFFTEGQWVISATSLLQHEPSAHALVCAEDCTLVVGNEQAAQEMFTTFPRFETIARAVMETAFAEQQKAMTSHLTDTPEQRYLKLQKTRPDLFQRVPQYQIASYLGVKPESLSRIRKRLLEKQ